MTERPLHCTIRNPVLLTITDTKSDFNSGCRIIDVSLSNIINPEVGEIHFKNSYVAYMTVKAKCRITDSKDGVEVKWRTCVKRMRLMPNPHVEAGAQDYFIITRKNMLFDLVNVSALRLILQQPSPVWKDFKIEDLKVFRSSESSKPSPLPAWLTDSPDKSGKKQLEQEEGELFPPPVVHKDTDIMEYWDMGIANLENLSTSLQQLWALSEEVAAHQTNRALGRYEVDGCYEINLLSYS